MEIAFKVLKCSDSDKVIFATYMLRGNALDWWESEEEILKSLDKQITWNVFKTAFFSKYFSNSIRTKKEREFIQLEQGSMIVAQYEAKFTRLSRFAPYMISTEENKARQFQEGLETDIKNGVRPFVL